MGEFFIYLGDNKSFLGNTYFYDNGPFLSESKGKLPNLEELEISRYYFNRPAIPENAIIADVDYVYGTVAEKIYENMCDKYGWNRNVAWRFGKFQELYAYHATQEKYSVWFLANSNWTKTVGGVWENMIFQDKIEEYWPLDTFRSYPHTQKEIRTVFAKNDKGNYVFLGVFMTLNWVEKTVPSTGKKIMVKTYKRISKAYPFQ